MIAKYNRFAERVDELGLQRDVDAKPILDVRSAGMMSCRSANVYRQGHEIVQILSARKPGQWTGKVLAEVIKWQLGHPGDTKEQCAEWLKEELAAGRFSIEDVASSTQAKRQKGGPKGTTTKKART